MADQNDGSITQSRETTHEGLVVIAATVTVELDPVVTEHLDEVQSAGPVWVPGHLDLLGGRERLKDLLPAFRSERLQLMQLLTDIDLRIAGQLTNLLNLLLQLHQGLLELKQGSARHGQEGEGRRRQAAAA